MGNKLWGLILASGQGPPGASEIQESGIDGSSGRLGLWSIHSSRDGVHGTLLGVARVGS